MEVTKAIDELVFLAYSTGRTEEEEGEAAALPIAQKMYNQRNQVLASIKAWCDCGKGDACPQYGSINNGRT